MKNKFGHISQNELICGTLKNKSLLSFTDLFSKRSCYCTGDFGWFGEYYIAVSSRVLRYLPISSQRKQPRPGELKWLDGSPAEPSWGRCRRKDLLLQTALRSLHSSALLCWQHTLFKMYRVFCCVRMAQAKFSSRATCLGSVTRRS